MTKILICALEALETDEVFGAAQIVILPALLFLACAVYGG